MKALYIFWKELRSYLLSPVAYIITGTYLVLTGFLFSAFLVRNKRVDFYPLFVMNMTFLLNFMVPVLTMGLVAEERKQRTMVLLGTSPVTTWEIILGKFSACQAYLTGVFLISGVYPLVLMKYGDPDLGQVAAAYLGAWLCGAAFVAIGVFTSSLSDSQMLAAIVAFGINLFFWLIHYSEEVLRHQVADGAADLVRAFSLQAPLMQFVTGAVHLKYVLTFLSFTFFFLYLATRRLAATAWR